MDLSLYLAIAIIICPVLCSRGSREDWSPRRNQQQNKVKREMLAPRSTKRAAAPPRFRDSRKKIIDDRMKDPEDLDDREDLTIAVGPPPRPKPIRTESSQSNAAAIVKAVLTQLTQEFIFKQVDENFVFGQYVGNAMRSLTQPQRLTMQREILELIIKYTKMTRGDSKPIISFEKNATVKEEDSWDFTKLDQMFG